MTTHAPDYPTINRWLITAPIEHPWKRRLATEVRAGITRPTLADKYLAPMETIAAQLERTNAPGLSRPKKRFAKDTVGGNLFGTRFELLAAYRLDLGGYSYAFGGSGQPDLGVSLNSTGTERLSIELTAQLLDDVWTLAEGIEKDLANLNVVVNMRLGAWPPSIPSGVRNVIRTRIETTARSLGNNRVTISLEELEPSAMATLESSPASPLQRVFIQDGLTERYLDNLALGFRRTVLEKSSQARSRGWPKHTLLMIDATSASFATVMDASFWPRWLCGIGLDWQDVAFGGIVIGFTNLFDTSLRGGAASNPEAPASVKATMVGAASALECAVADC